MNDERPELGEILLRDEIEKEVRGEYEAREASKLDAEKSKAFWALVIIGIVSMPVLALIAGLALRLFRWASGIR